MDKSSVSSSSADSTTATTTSNINGGVLVVNRDQFLKLNKLSHKISKPARRTTTAFDPIPPPPPQPQLQPLPQQNQPPVYNIDKSDFRDIVQKLTGSPAHERLPGTSCPIQPPKQQPSSRLQRIRPPPLVQMNHFVFPSHNNSLPAAGSGGYPINFMRPPPVPLSPLPPLPPVYTSVPEFPISSSYMHYLHGQNPASDYNLPQNETVAPPQNLVSSPAVMFHPSSPLSFGCLSPGSAA